ncbi:MAG: response regulator [Pirellulaceae bacterium]
MAKARVLVVEDDRSLADILEYNLQDRGYEVIRSSDGQDAIQQAKGKSPDLIILDVMIPVMDGLEVCRRLRSMPETEGLPILMLTAKSEEVDQIVGYKVGADDYVTKPYSIKVLLERVNSLIRRNRPTGGSTDAITRGGITVDRVKFRVTIDGKNLELTPSEFRLLDTLIRQPGRAFDRSELIDSALGSDALVLERTIDVHIRSLRKKMGELADCIQTVRGVGYRFQQPETIE